LKGGLNVWRRSSTLHPKHKSARLIGVDKAGAMLINTDVGGFQALRPRIEPEGGVNPEGISGQAKFGTPNPMDQAPFRRFP
jgi:hypothetical protein